jgi:hypothetical protein
VIQRKVADVPKMVTEREKQALATPYFFNKLLGHHTRWTLAKTLIPGNHICGCAYIRSPSFGEAEASTGFFVIIAFILLY